MPLLKFFSFAGAALLALLFAADSYLPKPVARHEPQRFYHIRIAADRIGPEAITFSGDPVRFAVADTGAADTSRTAKLPSVAADEFRNSSTRDAMAQLTPASHGSVHGSVGPVRPSKPKFVKRRVRTHEPSVAHYGRSNAVVGWASPAAGFFGFN